MQTLLEKVTHIEAEAQDKLRRAEEAGQKELQDLLANEDNALASVRLSAEKKAAQIVQENIDKMDNEINALRQQGESSINAIHASAQANRKQAIAQAWNLLHENNDS